MNIKELRHNGYEKHKKNRGNNWVIAIVFVLYACAILALNFVISGFTVLLVPIFILPILFAFVLFHYVQGTKGELRFNHIFRFASYYTSPRYYGVFRFFFCFLVSLLVELIVESIAGFILFFVFRFTHNPDFIDSVNNLFNNIWTVDSTESLNELINGINNVLAEYTFWVSVFGSLASMVTFTWLVMRQTIGVYFRTALMSDNPLIAKEGTRLLIARHRWEYAKYCLALNWPLFALMILAYGGSLIACYFNLEDIYMILTICELSAVASMMFYFPFALANMEAIAEGYQMLFVDCANEILNKYIQTINNRLGIMDERPNRDVIEAETSNKDEEKEKEEDDHDDNDGFFHSDIEF